MFQAEDIGMTGLIYIRLLSFLAALFQVSNIEFMFAPLRFTIAVREPPQVALWSRLQPNNMSSTPMSQE